MRDDRAARTVDVVLDPMLREELLQAREVDVARKLRHAHHTAELPETVLASAALRLRGAVLKRNARARSVAAGPNLGSVADAVDKA
jgi:hypothetical protein